MSQHDMNLANAAGAAFRADLNDALVALVSNSSGATAPATTFAYQWWADTTTGLLKVRNAANSAWITVGTLASTNLGLQVNDATLDSLAGLSLAQGDILYATAADTLARLAKGTGLQQLRMNSGATAPEWATISTSGVTLGTAQATTSGTSIDFTSIPAGTKRICLNLSGVSTNGTSIPIVQLGDSGGVENTGYTGTIETAASRYSFSDGFKLVGVGAASWARDGRWVFELLDSSTNTWTGSGNISADAAGNAMYAGAGAKSLSGTLDRIRLTTQGGADTFDAGKVNIQYE